MEVWAAEADGVEAVKEFDGNSDIGESEDWTEDVKISEVWNSGLVEYELEDKKSSESDDENSENSGVEENSEDLEGKE